MSENLMTPAELAEHLHVTTGSLANWRYKGTGPKFVKAGRKVVYRVADVEAWLSTQTRQGTGEVAAA